MTFPRSPVGRIDSSPLVVTKPCCARMTVTVDGQPITTWCVLVDGHYGGHESPVRSAPVSNLFGPAQAKARRY